MGGPEGDCMFEAFICVYYSCKSTPIIGCKYDYEELCCLGSVCLAIGETPKPIGIIPNDKEKTLINVGLFCCTGGLKMPQTCVDYSCDFLFFHEACSCPCGADRHVSALSCAICCCQCAPEMGFMKPPPADNHSSTKTDAAPAVEMAR
jgi:hypothetical protein